MKILFLGTRGYIDVRSKKHYRHTSTLIIYKRKRLLIDCGLDWVGKLESIKPHAILLTHAHPDHAWGLKEGAPCPVYATKESWKVKELASFPIENKVTIRNGQLFTLLGMRIEVFAEEHSLRCPGSGYRITAGKIAVYYAGDLISIPKRHRALKGVRLYIGDGSTIARPMVRRKGDKLFGHTTIRAQLGWCEKEKIHRALFTHCGTQIVGGNAKQIEHRVQMMGKEKNVKAAIAYDGMQVSLR